VVALLEGRRVFTDVTPHPDLSGRPRFVVASRALSSHRAPCRRSA